MKKKVIILSLAIFVLMVSGCATKVTDEEIQKATKDLSNFTDLELQSELDARGSLTGEASKLDVPQRRLPSPERSKVVREVTKKYPTSVLQSVLYKRKIYFYEVKLNPETWEITWIKEYETEDLTRNITQNNLKKEIELSNEELWKVRKLQLDADGKTVLVLFNLYDTLIVEDFNGDNISLIEYNDEIILNEISVIIPTGISLVGKEFSVKIIDEQGQEESSRLYSIVEKGSGGIVGSAYQGKKKLLLISEREAKPLRLTAGFAGTPLQLAGDEASMFRFTCNNLKEIIPGHNRLGENRVNIIFQGLGFDADETGELGFVSYLPYLIDLNVQGYNLVLPPLTPNSGVQVYGLFGEEPFINNANLFNFWYSNEKELAIDETADGEGCFEYLPDNYLPEIAPNCKLTNKINIHLINRDCRSAASFSGVIALSLIDLRSIRTFVHEMGHAFGQLADEYVEEGKGNHWEFPNCAPNRETASDWWGWPTYYEGCSYTENNFRSSQNSIMRLQSISAHFEQINENHLCYRMAELTGKIPSCTVPVYVTATAEAVDNGQ